MEIRIGRANAIGDEFLKYQFLTPREFVQEEMVLPFKYDISFTSDVVDTRGEASRYFAKNNSVTQKAIAYNHDSLQMVIDGKKVDLIDFLSREDVFLAQSILFDATNLSFAELAIVMRLAISTNAVKRVSFIYVEPLKYSMKVWSPTEFRGVDLSKKIHDVDFIPTFYQRTLSSHKNYLLAFLGFEDVRLAKALDPDSGANFETVSAVFSVPPFQVGWETHALMANSRILKEQKLEEAFFVAGNQPYDA